MLGDNKPWSSQYRSVEKIFDIIIMKNISVHSLPNLTILSLSGCSKVTDDGIELIAENLRKLVRFQTIEDQ